MTEHEAQLLALMLQPRYMVCDCGIVLVCEQGEFFCERCGLAY